MNISQTAGLLARTRHYYSFNSPEAYQLHLDHQREMFTIFKWVLLGYGVVGIAATILVASIMYADGMRSGRYREDPREELGLAWVGGILGFVVWPIMVPMAFFFTGFAKHGLRNPFKF